MADLSVVTVGGGLKRQDIQRRENEVNPVSEFQKTRLFGTEAKLRRDDDAGANRAFPCQGDMLSNGSLWVWFIHRSSRSYYLFFNYLSYYLYGSAVSAKDQGESSAVSAKTGIKR